MKIIGQRPLMGKKDEITNDAKKAISHRELEVQHLPIALIPHGYITVIADMAGVNHKAVRLQLCGGGKKRNPKIDIAFNKVWDEVINKRNKIYKRIVSDHEQYLKDREVIKAFVQTKGNVQAFAKLAAISKDVFGAHFNKPSKCIAKEMRLMEAIATYCAERRDVMEDFKKTIVLPSVKEIRTTLGKNK